VSIKGHTIFENDALGLRMRIQCTLCVSTQTVQHVNSTGRRRWLCRQWRQWHWTTANKV